MLMRGGGLLSFGNTTGWGPRYLRTVAGCPRYGEAIGDLSGVDIATLWSRTVPDLNLHAVVG